MREIRFRAWDRYKKVMHSWSECAPLCDPEDQNGGLDSYFNKNTWVFMQYTGLKDKNGKEIYEGDVVQIEKSYIAHFGKHHGTVVYFPGGFVYKDTVTSDEMELTQREDMSQLEIVGNIYENPELNNQIS